MELQQRLFSDVSDKDRAIQVATYIATVGGEAPDQSGWINEAKRLAEADQLNELVAHVYQRAAGVFAGPEKEIEPMANVLVSLLAGVGNADVRVDQLLQSIATLPAPKAAVLKVTKRFPVYRAIVSTASRSGRAAALLPHLAHIDGWLKEWHVAASDARALHLELAEGLRKAQLTAEGHSVVRKYLSSFEQETGSINTDVKKVAVQAVVEAINTPSILHFDELLVTAAVRSIDDAASVPVKLLNILAGQSMTELNAFIGTNKTALEAAGVDVEAAVHKMRLFALAAFCNQTIGQETSYAQIGDAIGMPADDIERWIIAAVRHGLIDARMDQLKQTIFIARSSHRAFGTAEWGQLAERLAAWHQSVESVLQVIQNAKLIAEAQPAGSA